MLPSPVRIGGAATICLLAKSVAAAALHRDRGGPGQDVSADLRRAPHRLCPFYDRTWERIGAVAALRRRAAEGGSYHVHVSLTRVALWIQSLGLLDREWARSTVESGGDRHRYLDPHTFTADTPLGVYQGVTDQVEMSVTPGRYDPVLVPRGSSEAVWRQGT